MAKIKPTYQLDAEMNGSGSVYVDKSHAEPSHHPSARSHSCTDIPCVILFFIFIVAQVILSILIYSTGGNPAQLLLPRDSQGNMCTGQTSNLYYVDIVSCLNVDALVTGCKSATICVAQCPPQNYYYLIPAQLQAMYTSYCQRSGGMSAYFGGNIPASVSQSQYLTLVKNGWCPLYTIQSAPLFNRCLPSFLQSIYNATQQLVTQDTVTNQTVTITDLTNKPLSLGVIAQAAQYVVNLMNVKTFAQFVLEDFINASVLIVILLLITAVVSFIYIIILRWILAPLILLSLVGLIAGLSFSIYFCVTKYLSLKNNPNQNFQLTTDFSYYLSLSTTWLVFAIISAVVLLIVLLLVIVLMKRVRLALKLIGEASRAVTSVFTSLIFPLLPLALQLGCLAYFVANAVILACAGQNLFRVANSTNSTNASSNSNNSLLFVGSSCDPTNGIYTQNGVLCLFYRYGFDYSTAYGSLIQALNTYQWIPQLYNMFMLFWVETFIVGFNQMVLAGCFGTWYWSQQSGSPFTLLTAIKNTLIFHMGSIAFGSLLIAICKFLRTLIQLVERRLKSAAAHQEQLSCFITFVSCCCKCCLWCLEKVLKFISRNSYIMTAIWSVSFCRGAIDAVKLLAANPIRALVLDRVTDFVLFLGRLCITAGVGVLAFYFFSKQFYIDPAWTKYFAPDLHYYWLPLIAVILGSYFITKTFFTVFEMAVDTIFLCAMKDLDVNDGSEQKPYMMSMRLRKILKVHNMVAKHDPNENEKF